MDPQRRRATAGVTTAVLALLVVGALAGCTTAGSESSTGSGGTTGLRGPAAAGDSSTARTAGGAGTKANTDDRSVTTTGSLELSAADPVQASTEIVGVVLAGGGRIATMEQRPKPDASAEVTVRIPSAAFHRTLTRIERVGKVLNVAVDSTDVTSQVTDYGVRIAALRTSITRLEGLLARSSTTTDLVTFESTLTARETSLEQLLAQRSSLADRVALATLAISIEQPTAARSGYPADFISGFLAGSGGLFTAVSAVMVVLGVLLPWLVALAVPAAAALVLTRLVRTASRRRKSPSSA